MLRRFLYDKDGPVSSIELDCLKPRIGSGMLEEYANDKKDIDHFALHNIICGPINIIPLRLNKWNVPGYEELENKFKRVLKINREELLNTL